MTLAALERVIWIAALACSAALLWKLWTTGLRTSFRFLMLFLAWDAFGHVLLFLLPRRSASYGYAYFGLTAVEWVTYILIVFELLGLVAGQYKGIANLGRKVVNAALPLSACIAFATAFIRLRSSTSDSPLLEIFLLIERTVSIDVLVFLTIISLFLLWFPVPLSRNVAAYAIGFVLVFASKAAILFLGDFLGIERIQPLSIGLMALTLSVRIYWLRVFNLANQAADVPVTPVWSRTEEHRRLRQLETLNEALLRTTAKTRR